MSTPSRQIIGNLINILNGSAPPPVTRFLSFSGELTPQQVQALADAIQGTSVQLGFRLKGRRWPSQHARESCHLLVSLLPDPGTLDP